MKDKKGMIRMIRKVIRKSPIYPIYSRLNNLRYKIIARNRKELKIDSVGGKMILPLEDEGLSKELFLNKGKRERELLELIKETFEEGNPLVKPEDTIVEIGANIGYYALQWAKILNKNKGKLYAIEPNPKTFKYLERNIKLNGYEDKTIFLNKGISDKKETLPFYMAKSWNISRFLDKSDKQKANKKIKVDTIDNLFKGKKVNLLRMDVEGYEYNVIKGAQKVLKENDEIKILMELHPRRLSKKKIKEMIELFKKNRFKIVKHTDYWCRVKGSAPLSILYSVKGSQHFLLEKTNAK